MSIFKRGSVYWYHFLFNGEHIQKSTKQGNPRVARQLEAARRTALAKGEEGIEERKPVPMFRPFSERFLAHVGARHENKPQTVAFYTSKLSRLLEYAPIGAARLNKIDEGVIESYIVARRASVSPATVNRELATLRRMLRLAQEWKEINRVPRIRLLSGERSREFVLSRQQEGIYLVACPQPLQDLALLMLETGLRIGEALRLEWSDVTLQPLHGSRFGFIRIREGKSKNARRVIPLTDRAAGMLIGRREAQESEEAQNRKDGKQPRTLIFVFPNRDHQPYIGTSINHLHQRVCNPLIDGKKRRIFPHDFVLHSLRHTMLTRLGESGVDAFTIMRIAGHSSITVSQRYIHPTPEAVERAFERLQLAANRPENEPKRLPPATVSATLNAAVAVSH
jgi:integrase